MAERDSWATMNGATRVLDAEDSRIATGIFLTPGATALTGRQGIRLAPGNPFAVTATGTPDANIHIAKGQLNLTATRGSGAYLCTLDADKTINALATPAHATNARRDLIIAQQTDTYYGDPAPTSFVLRYIVGTPAGSPVDPVVTGSPDYMLIARVRVPALTTAITNALIDDLRPAWMVALGGVLPVSSAAERTALSAYEGQVVYRRDLDILEFFDAVAWRSVGTPAVSSLASITDPYTDQLAILTTDHQLYRWTGSVWIRQGMSNAGGKRYVTPGTLATVGGTPIAMGMDTGSITFLANCEYKIKFVASFQVTATGDMFDFQICDTTIAGAVMANNLCNGSGLPGGPLRQIEIQCDYKPGASNVTKTFVGRLQRWAGTGTCSVMAVANGQTYTEVICTGIATNTTDV
jgi:hypothetical protein